MASKSGGGVELLACPFCGGTPTLSSYAEGHGTTYRVECDCDVQGLRNSAIDAIALWQTRTTHPSPTTEARERAQKLWDEIDFDDPEDSINRIAAALSSTPSKQKEK